MCVCVCPLGILQMTKACDFLIIATLRVTHAYQVVFIMICGSSFEIDYYHHFN